MIKKLLIVICALLAGFEVCPAATDVAKTTFIYAVRNDTDTLKMDRYMYEDGVADKPVVLFAFGGGFKGGQREDPKFIKYFDFLVRNGYVVASIDYRTTMSTFNPSTGASGFVTALQGAVSVAVEDMLTATAYIIGNATEWGIDPNSIVVSGSSAGAITALQTEYLIASGSPCAAFLPKGFNYAGVVSFAGAVCSDSVPVWQAGKVCPMMLFHGDVDMTVPFKSVEADGMGMYGSSVISAGLTKAGVPHELYIVSAVDHSVAVSPMTDNLYDILAFLREFVCDRAERITIARQTRPGTPDNYNTDFGLTDFLKSNM